MDVNKYRTKGVRLVLNELAGFSKNALGNLTAPGFILVAVPLVLIWELFPRFGIVPSTLVPPPSEVAVTFYDLLLNHNLLTHIAHSLGRFFLGLGIAIAAAIPIGILMGWNMAIRKSILPLFQLLSPVPPPAWVPITIIILGVGLPMQTFLIFLGAFYPILFNTYQGVKDTDPRYLASARVFGASEFTLIRKVYIWHALGSIIMSVKTGIAMGLVMLIIAEMYGGRSGIGYMLTEAKDYFRISTMVVCMIIMGIIGWFLIEVLKYVEIKLALWRSGA
jgi:ABC-type nitrate/sulfonate/bicarbonate transport system permease component